MKITVIKYLFTYGDTDINKVQDELRQIARENAELYGKTFSECLGEATEEFEQCLREYTTTFKITKADIAYKVKDEYDSAATDIKVVDMEVYQEYFRRRELYRELSTLDIKKQLLKNADEGEGFINLNEDARNICVEVKVQYKDEDGELNDGWVSFEPQW